MPDDREQRLSLARKDDPTYRERIASARELIYIKNYAISNDHVENLLKESSLSPNAVRCLVLRTHSQ
jgi:hypothetical protein